MEASWADLLHGDLLHHQDGLQVTFHVINPPLHLPVCLMATLEAGRSVEPVFVVVQGVAQGAEAEAKAVAVQEVVQGVVQGAVQGAVQGDAEATK